MKDDDWHKLKFVGLEILNTDLCIAWDYDAILAKEDAQRQVDLIERGDCVSGSRLFADYSHDLVLDLMEYQAGREAFIEVAQEFAKELSNA